MTSSVPEELQDFLVPRPFHKTWAQTFICQPAAYFQPRTIDEITELVDQARIKKRTLMVVGSGHSPSDMTMTNDWLVNLDKFNAPIDLNSNDSGLYTDVSVEAGIRIYQINDYLKSKGLALQNLGSISEQSIAGLISTGTHGASAYHGFISQQIVDITIVDSAGKLRKCSSTENPDLFRAAQLSLGKIGIIVYVTIRTVPAFQIHSTQEIISFNRLIDLWDSVWTSSEFIRIWWFPYTDRCVLWRANKTDKPFSNPRESWYGTWSGRLFYQTLLWISVHIYPRLTPFVERFVFSRQYGLEETYGHGDEAVTGSVEGLNMDCLFSQYVNEWGLPLTNGIDTLLSLQKVIFEAAKEGRYFVHSPIEVRCSNITGSGSTSEIDVSNRKAFDVGPIPGNNLLPLLASAPKLPYSEPSKVTNENLTLYLNATIYRPFYTKTPYGEWFKAFEEIVYAAGGKPHWAKNFIGSSEIKASYEEGEMQGFAYTMDKWFGEDLVLYKKIREEVDPDGVFLSGKEWAVRNGIVD